MRASRSLLATRVRMTALALALALIGTLSGVDPTATAAPVQDWLGLAGLQALLDASPDGVSGHASTVLGGPTKGQQTPADLPLSVLSVVPAAGPAGALLLVRLDLKAPAMARIGNVAAGMSGSPVIVRDQGKDKIVGALSYGDDFTTDGLALATPIEDMLSVEAAGLTSGQAVAAPPRPRPIEPLEVGGRTISSVIVDVPGSAGTAKAVTPPDDGAAHFVPLLGLQIGGLPERSQAYRRLQKGAVAHGLRVLTPHGGGVAGRTDDFATDVVPGASAGTFFSVGDLPVGAIGTVTYTTSKGGVVAFGHPLLWQGPTAAFFTNAWVDGVWASSLGSYKLASPGRVRGTLVQDRAAGVGAVLDRTPGAVPVTGSATVTAGGRVSTRTARTTVAPVTFKDEWLRSDLPASAAVEPVMQAADVEYMPGSASTTLTIKVSDGTRGYTVKRTNLFDDGEDVLWLPGEEVYDALETLLDDEEGMTPASVTSVDLVTRVSSTRALATVMGITSPGLHQGRNTVTVLLRPYGSKTFIKAPVTLTIPPGMPLSGVVTVNQDWYSDDEDDEDDEDDDSSPPEDTSIAARVARLNAARANSDVVVAFKAEGSKAAPVTGIAHTKYVISGSGEAETSEVSLESSEEVTTSGEELTISGEVDPAVAKDTVTVRRRTQGSPTWQTIVPSLALTVDDDEGEFEIPDRPRFNSVYFVSYPGSGRWVLGSSARLAVAVRGRVTVRGTRTPRGFALAASVAPRVAGSTITFQRRSRGKWRTIKAVTTGQDGQARYVWRVRKGSYRVRARLSGSTTLTGNVSPKIRLKR